MWLAAQDSRIRDAVAGYFQEPGLLPHEQSNSVMAALKDEHDDIIEEVRGQGLMLGLKGKVPNQSLLQALAAERMTAAAMFGFPDFFKVGISESGNHDNSIYNRSWSEKHDGVKEVVKDDKVTFEYDIDKNQDIAKNLKGRILLITGDIDNNVHPSNTYRLADALIKANKRFDFMSRSTSER